MIFDLFDSPELLDIQRTGFYHFLKEGISQLLAKEFPIKIKNGNYSIELCLSEKNVKLVAPEDNPRDCILKMKTYNCKLYAQVKIICKKSSNSVHSSSVVPKENDVDSKIVYQSLPEWVLLGQLPMMTKRGHFIINGSPRVIVHQVVRAPGIYFQKLIKKDDQNRARFYGDIIPLKGVWVRLQMTKKGRVEAKFKKGKKVEVEALQKCLQVIENQTLFKSIQKLPLKPSPFKYGIKKNSIPFPFTVPYGQPMPVPVPVPVPVPYGQGQGQGGGRGGVQGQHLLRELSNTQDEPSLRNEERIKLLGKKKSRAESKAEHDAFVHTYDKLYRTAQDKELEEWQKKKKNQIFFKGINPGFGGTERLESSKKICRAKSLRATVGANKLQEREPFYKNGLEVKRNLHLSFEKNETLTLREKKKEVLKAFISSNAFKRKKCSENLFATFKMQSRYDLGSLGREKIKSKFGSASYKSWPSISNSKDYASSPPFLCIEDASPSFLCIEDATRRVCIEDATEGDASSYKSTCVQSALQSSALQLLCASRKKLCTCTHKKGGKEKEGAPLLNHFQNDDTTQLTSSDLWNATLWLYRLRKGEESIDDIDHSQNRRVRTSGELLQSSFENGVYRLKNLLSTKLQEWRGSLSSSSFSSIFKSSYKARYNPKLLSKAFAGYVTLKKVKALIFKSKKRKTPLFIDLHKRSFATTVPSAQQSGLQSSALHLYANSRSFFIYKERFCGKDKKKAGKTRSLFISAVDVTSTLGKRKTVKGEVLSLPSITTLCLAPAYKSSCVQSSLRTSAKQSEQISLPLHLYARRFVTPSAKLLARSAQQSFTRRFVRVQSSALFAFARRFVRRSKEPTGSLRVYKKKCKKKQRSNRSSAKLCSALQLQKYESCYLLPAPKIKELFSTKPITGALREFFGSNPLSQYMDQTNPLAEITHKRRISSLGIGGVSRESAGMAIRGIHPTHYGRICPIETPEGKNAGLVNSLAFYTKVDKNGFLKTPYYRVFKGQVQSALGFSFWRAKEESVKGLQIAPSDLQKSSNNILRTRFSTVESVPVRVAEPSLDVFKKENPYKVQAIAISPIQMISVATSLIPFLEHNDANRALMGSNMQRQAVPLMISERPIVGTGLESTVILESGHITESQTSGFVSHVSANKIIVDRLLYRKQKVQAAKEGLHTNFHAHASASASASALRARARARATHAGALHAHASASALRARARARARRRKRAARACLLRSKTSIAHADLARSRAKRRAHARPFLSCAYKSTCKAFYKSSYKSSICTCTCTCSCTCKKMQPKVTHLLTSAKPSFFPREDATEGDASSYKSTGLCTCTHTLRYTEGDASSYKSKICTHKKGGDEHKVQTNKKVKVSFLISTISPFTTFSRSNQNTCITEKPLVREFDWVQKGDSLTDCSASKNGELAVGKNVLLAYIPWEGYNFEDAIVISDRLVREHVYTSLHIERYVFQAQDLKEGAEWFTKHLPGVDSFSIQHLEESGLPKIGSFLKEGDIIVGKIRYLNKKPSSPYERLLCDILGEKNFAARNKSLYVPKGVEARVIYHKIISFFDTDPENKVRPLGSAKTVHLFLGEKRGIQVGDKISGRHGNKGVISTILPRQDMPYLPDGTPIDLILNPLGVPSRMNVGQVLECLLGLAATYLNSHFKISAFDERYGVEASKSIVFLKLYQARLMSGQNWLFQVSFPGKTRLVDGRSGECFDQWITVGKAYILKLIHMVSEKIHARSTGPYALITQQPLRGRSNKGGQRLGEMEVWALEGFGAAYTLQELLTKKSDDFFGRKQIVDSILPSPASVIDTLKPSDRISKNKNVLGHPEIFKVLLCELQALCLDLGVYIVTPESFQRTFLGVVH